MFTKGGSPIVNFPEDLEAHSDAYTILASH